MIYAADKLSKRKLQELFSSGSSMLNYELLVRYAELDAAAEKILEASYETEGLLKKDALDRFIEFVFLKVQTGYFHIYNLAYPVRRISDPVLEERIVEILNTHLYPEIVLKLLKFFARNVHDSDANISLANLITSPAIIKAIFDTYILFKKDIFIADPEKRTLNVKRIQQFSQRSDNTLSSPLDTAARFKYILEFFKVKMNIDLYTTQDIQMSANIDTRK